MDKSYISNGTRQGCPLSPLIFSLLMEPLAEAVRSCDLISGIEIDGYFHKIGLFANDVVLTLTNLASSLDKVQELLEKCGLASYYKTEHK